MSFDALHRMTVKREITFSQVFLCCSRSPVPRKGLYQGDPGCLSFFVHSAPNVALETSIQRSGLQQCTLYYTHGAEKQRKRAEKVPARKTQ
jgi:hypothetical protein